MNCVLEYFPLLNILKSLEVNFILKIMMNILENMMTGSMKVFSQDMPQTVKDSDAIKKGFLNWLTVLTSKQMKEFM